MRITAVLFTLGKVLLVVGGAMLIPLLIACYYGEDGISAFIYTIALTWLLAGLLLLCCRSSRRVVLRQREGFLFVTLTWLVAAFLGALPFWFSGVFPAKNFIDALFESMSGFSTTGATVLTQLEYIPKGLLFWRSLTHWLGGAGIVMLFVAFLRGKDSSGSGMQIFNAEHSGGDLAEKITPRISDAAKALCLVYVGLTLAQTLLLLAGGLNLFDALTHTFGTVSTGGFSVKDTGIAYYNSAYIEWVFIIFMFLSSINLAMYYLLVARNRRNRLNIFRDEETRLFTVICLGAAVLVAVDLGAQGSHAGQSFSETLRSALFQVVSIISTTGYSTTNYNIWPPFAQLLLFLLMFVGGCIGSTSSSIKVSRIIVAFKACRNELLAMAHPHTVQRLYFNKKVIGQATVMHILFYILSFCSVTLGSALVLAFTGLNISDALHASLACISNVGAGLGNVGYAANYADFTTVAKCALIFNMLIGRLEIFTVAVLFLPSAWKK